MYHVNRIKSDLCKDEIGETPNRKFFELLNFNVYTQQNFINVKDAIIDKLKKMNRIKIKIPWSSSHFRCNGSGRKN